MYLIYNADSITGFYLINRLIEENTPFIASYIRNEVNLEFKHPNANYIDKDILRDMYWDIKPQINRIIYLADHERISELNFVDELEVASSLCMQFKAPLNVIMDWELFNGVKRGNLPISTATSPSPDSRGGVDKSWIYQYIRVLSKKSKVPMSCLITPSVLSPLHMFKSIRKENEYYLAQKVYDVVNDFKSGLETKVNKGDLKVHYDIVHSTDVALASLKLLESGFKGIYMLSSNKKLLLREVIESTSGAILHCAPILLKNCNVAVVNSRRSIENYDTYIDMVSNWSNVVRRSQWDFDTIINEIVKSEMIRTTEESILNIVLSNS